MENSTLISNIRTVLAISIIFKNFIEIIIIINITINQGWPKKMATKIAVFSLINGSRTLVSGSLSLFNQYLTLNYQNYRKWPTKWPIFQISCKICHFWQNSLRGGGPLPLILGGLHPPPRILRKSPFYPLPYTPSRVEKSDHPWLIVILIIMIIAIKFLMIIEIARIVRIFDISVKFSIEMTYHLYFWLKNNILVRS